MSSYREALAGLNAAQRQAVETIDGPVLVIAGPGTGKTQLLGVRVAHILHETDTLPQNILCLTFTESGATNMRDRLTRFIGQDAYGVTISTYHAFGGDLIHRFPEAFADIRLQTPIDQLSQHQVLQAIIDTLPYSNPLKQLRWHIDDLVSTVSEVKRALLSADSLRAVAAENLAGIKASSKMAGACFATFTTMPRKLDAALPPFTKLLKELQPLAQKKTSHTPMQPLMQLAITALSDAIAAATASGKTTPLTAWKNTWLAKNADNKFVLTGELETARIAALADVLEQYEAALASNGWYDFDDMILRAITALKDHADLRFTLQEQYLYILLDEFQDTNAAQFALIQLLSDNPVHEGCPNIMAVGDDDQAIYAFQGAQYSNMLDFYRAYRDVTVVNLTDNYRSAPGVLTAATGVANQITTRLGDELSLNKTITAAGSQATTAATIERHEFLSDVAQYDWIAARIASLIENGTAPSEIAVLAPKHKYLEPLVPHLAARATPMRYEKRENILEAPVVRQLLTMARLVQALADEHTAVANTLWPQVLSFDFWNISTSDIWQLSWGIADAKEHNWSKALLASPVPQFRQTALLLLALASRANLDTSEYILDCLIGTETVTVGEADTPVVQSPLRTYYTGPQAQAQDPAAFYSTISHLTVLRLRLREHAATATEQPKLRDLLAFVDLYETSGERMLNTSPYNQQAEAVQLMTVFKAKGLEFSHVFIVNCLDDVWGSASRGNSNKLTLPANLAPIRHAGATDDERLRILFVALTRAKTHLYLTSFGQTFTGKATKRLKYLDEQEQPDGSFKSMVLPSPNQAVQMDDTEAPSLPSLERNWRQRHMQGHDTATMRTLLADRLANYQLSPTHLTHFIDLEYAGPESFFFDILLRFPHAPTADSQFGDAMHQTLEWVQHFVTQHTALPPINDAQQYFKTLLKKHKLDPTQLAVQEERGKTALAAYLAQRGTNFAVSHRAEHNFRNEGVVLGNAHLSGKIDRMEIDPVARTITVVDYKTGKSHARWASDAKLHKYALQLYSYKLLIEHSRSFKGYTVPTGRLEFVEPDAQGTIHTLELSFTDSETARVAKLLVALWQRIQALDFPDVTSYEKTLTGIKALETALLEE